MKTTLYIILAGLYATCLMSSGYGQYLSPGQIEKATTHLTRRKKPQNPTMYMSDEEIEQYEQRRAAAKEARRKARAEKKAREAQQRMSQEHLSREMIERSR